MGGWTGSRLIRGKINRRRFLARWGWEFQPSDLMSPHLRLLVICILATHIVATPIEVDPLYGEHFVRFRGSNVTIDEDAFYLECDVLVLDESNNCNWYDLDIEGKWHEVMNWLSDVKSIPTSQNTTCLEILKIHKSDAIEELLMMKSSGEATKTFTTNSYRCTAKQDSSNTIPLLQIVTVAAFVLIVFISFGCQYRVRKPPATKPPLIPDGKLFIKEKKLEDGSPNLSIGTPIPMGQVVVEVSELPKAILVEQVEVSDM